MRASVYACLAVLLACLLGPASAAAHAGSMAFWKVTVGEGEARSEIVVSLVDFGWTPEALASPEQGGALSDARRLAIARELLEHFVVLERASPVPGRVVAARLLPSSGSIEVVATHSLSHATAPLVVRSTFHELTDESHRVIGRVERDGMTTSLVFTADSPEHALPDAPPMSWRRSLAPTGSLRALLLLGIEHILTGYDHLIFLLCLLVPGGTWRSRLAIVTAFTVAHSVTLVLAALQVVTPPARFVEAAIAVSIAYVAIENLLHAQPRTRWPTAFGFGLVHGFGFAGMLNVLDVPVGAFVSSVVAFNVGVEIGQLAVVAVAVPLVAFVSGHAWHRRLVQSTSVIVCGLAAYWIVERLQ